MIELESIWRSSLP